MQAARFDLVRTELDRLLDSGVQGLHHVSGDIRPDGLPQNWVDDLPNLTPTQRATLAADIPAKAPAWAEALRLHLAA